VPRAQTLVREGAARADRTAVFVLATTCQVAVEDATAVAAAPDPVSAAEASPASPAASTASRTPVPRIRIVSSASAFHLPQAVTRRLVLWVSKRLSAGNNSPKKSPMVANGRVRAALPALGQRKTRATIP